MRYTSFALLLCIGFGCASSHPPCALPKETLSQLDELFVPRLQEFVALDASADCSGQYDLLRSEVRKQVSTSQYCENRPLSPPFSVIAFVPDLLPSDMAQGAPTSGLSIFGCAEIETHQPSHRMSVRVSIDAYYEHGDWYFTKFRVEGPIGTGGEPCELTPECKSAWLNPVSQP